LEGDLLRGRGRRPTWDKVNQKEKCRNFEKETGTTSPECVLLKDGDYLIRQAAEAKRNLAAAPRQKTPKTPPRRHLDRYQLRGVSNETLVIGKKYSWC